MASECAALAGAIPTLADAPRAKPAAFSMKMSISAESTFRAKRRAASASVAADSPISQRGLPAAPMALSERKQSAQFLIMQIAHHLFSFILGKATADAA